MIKTRRRHSAEFKAKVALEALKEHKTMSELAQSYTIHANQITEWKKTLLEQSPLLFGRKESPIPSDEALDAATAPLYQQIGQLKVELDFLKKKLKLLAQQ
jgi:putative transposase